MMTPAQCTGPRHSPWLTPSSPRPAHSPHSSAQRRHLDTGSAVVMMVQCRHCSYSRLKLSVHCAYYQHCFHTQGVRESAGVPQFVMLCRRWAQLQCFAGRTGRTAGCCVAGKRAQYRKIRPFPKNLRSQILVLSPYSLVKALVGAFNQEKALVGAYSVIVKTDCETDGSFYSTSWY